MNANSDIGMKQLRAAVIGLGKVGSRFDEEEGRTGIWSHVGAYAHLASDFELVAAVEPGAENRAAFAARMPHVPVYSNTTEMIAACQPEVVSICTPAPSHGDILDGLLAVPDLMAVWCEKPLSDSLATAKRMIAACEARNLPMVVTHNRRFMPLWRRARALIDEGTLGSIRCVRIAMPNRVLSVGSHAVDLAIMLGGPVSRVVAMDIPAMYEEGENATAALLEYADGAYGIIQVTGMKAQLVVEAEVLGDRGRISVREDRDTIAVENFRDKPGVSGYNELSSTCEISGGAPEDHSAFVAAGRELAGLARGQRVMASCGATDALAVMEVLDQMTGQRLK